MIRPAGLAALIVVAGLCQPTVAGREPRLKDVLSRLEAYLTTYETQLGTLVAEEHYEQWIKPENGGSSTLRRALTSDFGFLRLPGRPEWLGVRDTFEVGGQPVPDHQRLLDRLLLDGSPDSRDLARRIVDENVRYNLGAVARTINVPMLALDLLSLRNRQRLTFDKHGEDHLDGRIVWVVTFRERERPTLVKTPDGGNRPAHGTAWIDPVDGALLRTDLEFDGVNGNLPATSITVLYGREVTLGLLVPYEMREVYRMKTGGDPEEIHAVAGYTDFRQFRTSARIVPR
jgi:hypothetical protein